MAGGLYGGAGRNRGCCIDPGAILGNFNKGAATRTVVKLADEGLVQKLRSRAGAHDWEKADRMCTLLAPQSTISAIEELGVPRSVIVLGPAMARRESPPSGDEWRDTRAVFAGSPVSIDALRILHQAGFRWATRQLAEVLGEQGDSAEGLAVLRMLIAGHDAQAVDLGERLRFASDPDRSERWQAADMDDLSQAIAQLGVSELPAKERFAGFRDLVVEDGLTSAAEDLAILCESIWKWQLGAPNLRQFGFRPDGTIPERPK